MELALLDKRSGAMIQQYLPDNKTANEVSEFFTAFSDSTRVKILSALSISSMCVNDLSSVLGINQTTLSHQLKLLRSVDMVKTLRQGKVIFYSITSPDIIDALMCSCVEHLNS